MLEGLDGRGDSEHSALDSVSYDTKTSFLAFTLETKTILISISRCFFCAVSTRY